MIHCRQHYLLYSLTLAMQPRMLVTLMEDEKKQLKQVCLTLSLENG